MCIRDSLEIVLEHDGLAVEMEEGEGVIPVHAVENSVDQVDQPQPVVLAGEVPLPIPMGVGDDVNLSCLLYTSPSPRDRTRYRMPSSA